MNVPQTDPETHARNEYSGLADITTGYPANHFAFQQVLNVLLEENAQRVLEVGIGHGNAIPLFAGAGFELSGMDIKQEFVEQSKSVMTEWNQNPERVFWGDIEDSASYIPLRAQAPFDALIAMGVLPHAHQEKAMLENMRALVKPGGMVFVECRNKLFSLITFNRYTHEFLMDDLLFDAPTDVREAVDEFIRPRLMMDRPPRSEGHQPLFHNPLNVSTLFREAGFTNIVIRPFHYHAGVPVLESELGQSFRDGSIAMENEPSGWRGLLLCSAFVVQAQRPINDHSVTTEKEA